MSSTFRISNFLDPSFIC
uniref:Uncharacterized protein n=1 Tax=Rhizophora mucronata TaxID=61149 RepID=A0A2P2NPM7_RHIMU